MTGHDVGIVGGGPAGTAAAILLAQQHFSVVLVERDAFPRHRPGETLHPGVEPILKQLDVADKVARAAQVRHSGVWNKSAGLAQFTPFGSDDEGPWRGFQIWRAVLDQILISRACELGVTLIQPCRAVAPIEVSGRIAGIQLPDRVLSCRVVIDAAGDRHWLARPLGLRFTRQSPRLVARYGYVASANSLAQDPLFTLEHDGWTWTANVASGIWQWTRLRSSVAPSPPLDGAPLSLAHGKPIGRPGGADVTWRIIEPLAGPGYFICGDAAAVVDPAASHGVLKALMSGMLAAHVIMSVFRGVTAEPHAAKIYDGVIRDWFHHDIRRLRALYQPEDQHAASR